MAHTRIRKFNTRDTYPEQKLDNDLCQAVIAGDTIYLRGQVPQDLDTSASVGIGDPGAVVAHLDDPLAYPHLNRTGGWSRRVPLDGVVEQVG